MSFVQYFFCDTNLKFDVSKAKIARQFQLFSFHFYDSISVHAFA
jgi:hypothetical protein